MLAGSRKSDHIDNHHGKMSAKRFRRHTSKILQESPTRSPTKLTTLPLDTLIHVLFFLLPRDILSLRKCCKALCSATLQRTVWINATRQACLECNAFEDSFPVEDMTLSELEFVATARDRYLTRLWTEMERSMPLIPISTRILIPHPSQGSVNNMSLIPGGRFLICSTSTNLVQLWDLGVTPHTMITHRPLASMVVWGIESDFELLMHPTPDGKGIFLLLTCSRHDGVHFCAYEIFPASENPAFRPISALSAGHIHVRVYALSGDRFAFYGDDQLVVWNFLLDKCVMWKFDLQIYELLFSDNNLILLEGPEISIFEIPPLRSRISESWADVDAGPQTPLLSLVVPLDIPVNFSQSTWHPGTSYRKRRCYIDAIGGDADGKTTICRYVLKHIDNKPSDGLPCSIPIMIDSLRNQDIFSNPPRFRSFQLSERERLLCWIHEFSIRVQLSTLAGSAEDPAQVKSGVLWLWPALPSEPYFTFCPMMGRLCVSSWDHEVRVLDYVVPPI